MSRSYVWKNADGSETLLETGDDEMVARHYPLEKQFP